ncbi:MAG TPA: hypothetical protein VGD09_10495, partial [Blastococcus sp.]
DQAARSIAEAARRPESRLPDVQASLEAAFGFAAQMLAEQRDFAKTLMSAGPRVAAASGQEAAPDAEPEEPTGPDVASAPGTLTPTAAPSADTTATEQAPVATASPPDGAIAAPAAERAAPTETPAKKATAKKATAKKMTAKKMTATDPAPTGETPAKKKTAAARKGSPAKRTAVSRGDGT